MCCERPGVTGKVWGFFKTLESVDNSQYCAREILLKSGQK